MLKQGKKLKAILSALIASAMAFQTAAPALALNAGTDDTIPEAHFAKMVFDDPSVYGESYGYLVDEDGNVLPEFNLIPDSMDRLDAALPTSYDLRKYNRVTSAKSQGSTGTCWAHSAMGAAESALITDGLATTSLDLSEAHLVWFSQGQNTASTDPLYNDVTPQGTTAYIPGGGNIYYSRGALASWIGADYEANYLNVTKQPQIAESYRYKSAFHLQKSVMFDSSDTASIKSYLMENGALTLSYYHDDDYELETSTYASYYQNSYTKTNHAVTLIGWDDNYSKSNFALTPPGNGAWIIKNSWGTDYGDDGCFYLSYYDTSIENIASLEFEKNTNYSNVYQYDMFASGTLGYTGYGITGANVFTASGSNPLAAVSFYTAEASNKYTIRIYSGVSGSNPASGTLVHTQTGTAAYAGYHTVPLSKTVSIPSGTKFSVLVTLENAGSVFWFDTNSNAAGQSFYTWGTGTASSSWTDAYTAHKLNVCIKAFTKSAAVAVPPANVKAAPGDGKVSLTWDKVEGATEYAVYVGTGTDLKVYCTTTALGKTVSGLTNGTKYTFLVRAKVNGTWSSFTSANYVFATPGSTKPVVKAVAGDGRVALTWGTVAGATEYVVYVGTGTSLKVYCTTTALGKTVSGLANGTKYTFLVRAKVNDTWSSFTSADYVYATPVGSAKPVVKATPGDGRVSLTWDKVAGATEYVVYVGTGTSLKVYCTTTALGKTVSGLVNGTKYTFLVRAKVNGTWGSFTSADYVYATPGTAKPVVKAVAGNGKVALTWGTVAGATEYVVYVGTGTSLKVYCTTTALGKTVSSLKNGTKYTFLVRAKVNGEWTKFTTADYVYATPTA